MKIAKPTRGKLVHLSPEAREPLFAVALHSHAPLVEIVAVGLKEKDADAMVKSIDEGPEGYTAAKWPIAWEIASSAGVKPRKRGVA